MKELHEHAADKLGDTEIDARIAQYEMAYRMQSSVPDVMDLSNEPESVFELYGPDSKKPGKFAAYCLLARRLAEKGVKFIQLYHQGWDQHGNLPAGIKTQCQETDQACAALITDLKQRGMLDDTLVIWGGEFGRTSYSQGKLTADNYGRDHHPRCFTTWMAGGGVKPGIVYGETDDFSYNFAREGVHVHDFHATMMHVLETTFAIFIGGLFKGLVERLSAKRNHNAAQKARVENNGVLLAAGLIAGVALVGLLFVAFAFFEVRLFSFFEYPSFIVRLVIFAVIAGILVQVPLKSAGSADEPAPPTAVM